MQRSIYEILDVSTDADESTIKTGGNALEFQQVLQAYESALRVAKATQHAKTQATRQATTQATQQAKTQATQKTQATHQPKTQADPVDIDEMLRKFFAPKIRKKKTK